jgi:hypothetical protein
MRLVFSDDVCGCGLVGVERPGQQFLGVVVVDLDPMSAPKEEACALVGICTGHVRFAVRQVAVLVAVAGGRVAVAGLDNKPATVGIQQSDAFPFTPCLLASLGAEELRINGVVGGVGGLFAHVDALVVVVERNLPVGFASTHEQRQPGRTHGHAHKPQLEAKRRDRVRTWAKAFTLEA